MLTVIATTKGIKEAQSGGVEPVRAHTEQVMGQQLKYWSQEDLKWSTRGFDAEMAGCACSWLDHEGLSHRSTASWKRVCTRRLGKEGLIYIFITYLDEGTESKLNNHSDGTWLGKINRRLNEGKEGEGASQGTWTEDSWAWTMGWGGTVGTGGVQGRGEQRGKRQDNCNWTTIKNKIKIKKQTLKILTGWNHGWKLVQWDFRRKKFAWVGSLARSTTHRNERPYEKNHKKGVFSL